VQKLQAVEKFALNQSLKELAEALRTCRDPMLDAELQRWSSSRWEVPRQQATAGHWVEYRLGDSDNREGGSSSAATETRTSST
jgi:hypothetical protein